MIDRRVLIGLVSSVSELVAVLEAFEEVPGSNLGSECQGVGEGREGEGRDGRSHHSRWWKEPGRVGPLHQVGVPGTGLALCFLHSGPLGQLLLYSRQT